MLIVYFSSVSEMTRRFVEKLDVENVRIPLKWDQDDPLLVDEDYVLVVPSYGAGQRSDAVPKQVVKFLNVESNRQHCKYVCGGGSTNYGSKYCLGARVVAAKLQVPLVFTYELLGTPEDVSDFKQILDEMDQ